eukprot:TRINITY_DN25008_c1_g4_i2.p1 TRINITY_DN25008_c1_g4~~TRINITY_DN25008_c1_g4_i2.p1  ORF type:complete len:263 (+),score=-15.12 TRINITY_DN25008_c1_g4_i2:408-1196(+)
MVHLKLVVIDFDVRLNMDLTNLFHQQVVAINISQNYKLHYFQGIFTQIKSSKTMSITIYLNQNIFLMNCLDYNYIDLEMKYQSAKISNQQKTGSEKSDMKNLVIPLTYDNFWKNSGKKSFYQYHRYQFYKEIIHCQYQRTPKIVCNQKKNFQRNTFPRYQKNANQKSVLIQILTPKIKLQGYITSTMNILHSGAQYNIKALPLYRHLLVKFLATILEISKKIFKKNRTLQMHSVQRHRIIGDCQRRYKVCTLYLLNQHLKIF